MLDTIRHNEVFSPAEFGEKKIDIIGVGATGSRIALSLAKQGLKNIHLWDYDKVEAPNIPNQIFGLEHIGQYKAEAMQKIIEQQTGTQVHYHIEEVNGTQQLGDIVYLLTDTMKSREIIWKAGIRYKPLIKLLIETRMGANSGRVYCLNPSDPTRVKAWEGSLYSDDVAEVSACGTSISVGPTAEMVSGWAVWQLIRWHQSQMKLQKGETPKDQPEFELIFSIQPPMITTFNA